MLEHNETGIEINDLGTGNLRAKRKRSTVPMAGMIIRRTLKKGVLTRSDYRGSKPGNDLARPPR